MTVKYTKEYILGAKKDLGILRGWFEGFAAAGGKVSSFEDSLRKAQILLQDYASSQNDKTPGVLAASDTAYAPSCRVSYKSNPSVEGTILFSFRDKKGELWLWIIWDNDKSMIPVTTAALGVRLVPEA